MPRMAGPRTRPSPARPAGGLPGDASARGAGRQPHHTPAPPKTSHGKCGQMRGTRSGQQGAVGKALASRCCGCSRFGVVLPSVVVLLQDGSNQDRHGGLSLRNGASSAGSIALSFVERHPPYPPLSGGQEKSKPSSARRGRIAFFTPLTRGSRGVGFPVGEGCLLYPLRKP